MDHVEHGMKKVEDWKEYAYGGNGAADTSALYYLDAVQEVTRYVGDLLNKCATFEELKTELTHFKKDREEYVDHAYKNDPYAPSAPDPV